MNTNNAVLGIIIVGLVVISIIFFSRTSRPAFFSGSVIVSPTPTILPTPSAIITETPSATVSPVPSSVSISVVLSPVLNSPIRQEGNATLTSQGDTSKVIITVNQDPTINTPQPAHIHQGSCANTGKVIYPLNSLVNGRSETILNTSLENLKNQGPLSINVHKSDSELNVYTACGQFNQ